MRFRSSVPILNGGTIVEDIQKRVIDGLVRATEELADDGVANLKSGLGFDGTEHDTHNSPATTKAKGGLGDLVTRDPILTTRSLWQIVQVARKNVRALAPQRRRRPKDIVAILRAQGYKVYGMSPAQKDRVLAVVSKFYGKLRPSDHITRR